MKIIMTQWNNKNVDQNVADDISHQWNNTRNFNHKYNERFDQTLITFRVKHFAEFSPFGSLSHLSFSLWG